MSATQYDFRDNSNLLELAAVASDKITAEYREVLRNAVKTGNFASYAQLPGACAPECVEYMTIGELRGTKNNESGDQFIDPKAAHKVLFGTYGICKPTTGPARALALPIQVTYTKGQFDHEPTSPCISSGRHRLMALCILLNACGLSEFEIDEVPVRVTTCVVRDEKDFAMIMETNNQSRRQSTRELANHKLVSLGIVTNDIDELIENASVVYGKVARHAETFAQAVALQTDARVERNTVFSAVKSAYTNVKSADKSNAPVMKELFAPGNNAELQSQTEYVASEVGAIFDNAMQPGLTGSEVSRAFKEGLAGLLAQRLGVVAPVFKTKEERDRESLQTLEAKAAALKNTYNL